MASSSNHLRGIERTGEETGEDGRGREEGNVKEIEVERRGRGEEGGGGQERNGGIEREVWKRKGKRVGEERDISRRGGK